MSEAAQSGTRTGGHENLETVRKAYRDGKYGTKKGSMESLATQHLSTKEPLGNYAPFTDLLISSGHDSASVSDYQRTLDSRTGLGTVSYSIGTKRFTREFFCSHPHDVVVARFTAGDAEGTNVGGSDNAKLNLSIQTTTKHKVTKLTSADSRIVLTSEVKMVQDNIDFMQIVNVQSKGGSVEPQDDGSIKVTDATEVVVMLAGYTDYLPIYPTFKGRDFQSDCKKTILAATDAGFDVLKKAHVDDVSELMNRCRLELEYKPSSQTTDKLVAGNGCLELENLYFNYSRYLQLCCSRSAPVPSNLQGLWNSDLKPAWNCDYHTDINVQMNYWMVDPANLPDSFRPFVEWSKDPCRIWLTHGERNLWRRQRLEHGTQQQRLRLHRAECTRSPQSTGWPLAVPKFIRSLCLHSGP